MRILGKGKVGKSIFATKEYKNAKLYDDSDKEIYDISSNELTIVSPGMPPHNYLVKNTKNLISEYDLLLDKDKYSIWISGTNGKTSTTRMIGDLLKNNDSQVGGNIGVPLSNMNKSKKIWILETSSFVLAYNKTSLPNIYVLLPIKDDHINWHGSFEAYKQAKLNVIFKMKKDSKNIAFIPKEYKNICRMNAEVDIVFYDNAKDLAKQFGIDINKITLNEPFRTNGVLASCVSVFLGNKIDYEAINNFISAKHTFERVLDSKNRLWINDSKATNKDATLAGLRGLVGLNKKIYLILGGDSKGVDFSDLFSELKKYDIELFIIGKDTSVFCKYAKNNNITYFDCGTLQDAVSKIDKKLDNQNSVCLFAPACASFDQFNSYKHRGEVFKGLIKDIK